jgi:penicillin G amidase
MKWIKRLIISSAILILLMALSVYLWLRSSRPTYEGEITLPGLSAEVIIHYDNYGVPTIEAQNKHDLYRAFGYRHAAERLFQMEMLRRAGSGRLAEIIGQPLIKVDHLFRTLGVPSYAKQSALEFESLAGQPIYNDVHAYLEGINHFVQTGPLPPEFSIIGIEPKPFTVEDMFCTLGAMSFSFSQGQKTEFIIDHISTHFGEQHLKEIALYHQDLESFIPSQSDTVIKRAAPFRNLNVKETDIQIHAALGAIAAQLPVTPFEGSNAWVLSGNRTESGHVLFCNDTHIGYNLPQTWYEAQLICPGFKMYGHFLAGIPFALVGRNDHLSWGLTMLLNDDIDFYKEDISNDKYLSKGEWQKLKIAMDTIRVKGQADTLIELKYTAHGPIINSALRLESETQPISLWWTYTKCKNQNIDALFTLNNAQDITAFTKGLSMIHAPGLNVNYGDREGNVAWWACAHLVRRPSHVNSYTLLEGTTGNDDPLGYYTFEENPKNINPSCGFIYSANDWPQKMNIQRGDTLDSLWYPGYYKPQYRADRIVQLIQSRDKWNLLSIQEIMNDHCNPMDALVMNEWHGILRQASNWNDANNQLYHMLFDWDGTYQPLMPHPTFFAGMLYHVLHETMADELGEKRFQLFLETHQMQRAYGELIFNDKALWWDKKGTAAIETRQEIFQTAYKKTIAQLSQKWGANPKLWSWANSAQIELKHPLGEVALLKPIFNIGPAPVFGGNESIRQAGYYLDSSLTYKVFYGSQMRIILDFNRLDSALNIAPAGQSGHVMSPHYDDQFENYMAGKFRKMPTGNQAEPGTILKLKPQ